MNRFIQAAIDAASLDRLSWLSVINLLIHIIEC